MFFGSKKPNLTLIFSFEHLRSAYERVCALINFKMHDIYRNICFWVKKAISDIIFPCEHLGLAYKRVRAHINFKMYDVYQHIGSKKPYPTLPLTCNQPERAHECARS